MDGEDRNGSTRIDSASLNVQPRQRREVYLGLAKSPEGRSVKDLLGEIDMPESDLRESLRKLASAGLAKSHGRLWTAVALEPTVPKPVAEEVVEGE